MIAVDPIAAAGQRLDRSDACRGAVCARRRRALKSITAPPKDDPGISQVWYDDGDNLGNSERARPDDLAEHDGSVRR